MAVAKSWEAKFKNHMYENTIWKWKKIAFEIWGLGKYSSTYYFTRFMLNSSSVSVSTLYRIGAQFVLFSFCVLFLSIIVTCVRTILICQKISPY